MKKLKPINLQTLSQAEMADKELHLLRGGSGSSTCACITMCVCSCACPENGDSGTSLDMTYSYARSSFNLENTVDDYVVNSNDKSSSSGSR